MHPDLLSMAVTQRHRDLIAEAERERLAASVGGVPAWRAWLGRRLISVGQRLVTRPACAPIAQSARVARG